MSLIPLNAPQPLNAVVHNLLAEKYREHDGLSHSEMKGLHPTPAHYLSGQEEEEEDRPSTTDQVLGTICHTLVLEPGSPLPQIAIRPEGMKFTTNEGKAWRDAQLRAGLVIMTKAERESAGHMAKSISQHPLASAVLRRGQSEVSYFRTRETKHGLVLLKARLDFVPDGVSFLVDLKTARSAEPEFFRQEMARKRYHSQAAHYLDIHNHLVPDDPRNEMVFFVVEKKPPFLVACYTLSPDFLNQGRDLVERDIETFARCSRAMDFPGYSKDPIMLSPPHWLKSMTP